ncbi:hypothetical protein LPY66_05980 [Dehalobacter sp. DCM]|uniref:hypothetical protein n=1 Tax=Dehalobacter sp. DCM TaxID=2907827 RepID=UPI003081B70A|nr:hypothetical protein LPY66_05980 [Dehalobacter sp. DCM]
MQLVIRVFSEKSYLTRFMQVLKILFLVMIIIVYAHMFVLNYSDWFHKPSVARGVIESIKTDNDFKGYTLVVITGEERLTVKVDPATAAQLQKHDLIEVTYLSQKRDAVKCTVLTRQAQNSI